MSKSRFHPLTISRTRALPGGIAISLHIPDDLTAEFTALPGQYLTLEANLDGESIRRSYSICSHYNDSHMEIGIKQIASGLFSTHAMRLQAGDTINAMPPEGRFTTNIDAQASHHYLLVAAGSGITPCLGIAKSVLKEEPKSQISMMLGNRTTKEIMFKEDLDALKNTFINRFHLVHVLSGEQQEAELLNGRINGEKIAMFHQHSLIQSDKFDGVYLCGPMGMVESVAAKLPELGVSETNIHTELFTTGNEPQINIATGNLAIEEGDDSEKTPVELILDGKQHFIKVDAARETVLTAAIRAGIDMPYSCAGGMCCTCRAKVLKGNVTMDANFSLADWEVQDGFTLTCQARPTTNDKPIVIDFDAT